ncbi:hypothetical protein GCM10009821_05930 [Aeromicrobium halocynthiae]|uniref:Uncharacterized protein n=1 Tax=Aeromicrobium halocynthiae TaxID=560557 RepID=A0ABN2VSM4_9ACTN
MLTTAWAADRCVSSTPRATRATIAGEARPAPMEATTVAGVNVATVGDRAIASDPPAAVRIAATTSRQG